MADSEPEPEPLPSSRVGLPDPDTVVSETLLRPSSRAVAASADARRVTTYRILHTTQTDPYDDERAATVAPTAATRAAGEEFGGTARRATKLSIANAPTEPFADLADLIASLPAHRAMVERRPPINRSATARRVAEEVRNVRVRAFLYAASREDDNDYHLIVGRDPSLAPAYLTVEISGLPPSGSRHAPHLRAARAAYQTFFGADLPGRTYDFYDPPIEVEIDGSLFFDVSHASGSRPGPQSLRPDMPVVWEIHPVAAIVLEP